MDTRAQWRSPPERITIDLGATGRKTAPDDPAPDLWGDGTPLGSLLVSLRGELDSHTAPAALAPLDLLMDLGIRRILLDCTGLTFCGAAGLSLFMRCRKRLAGLGGTFTVVNPSSQLTRILRITRLTDLLNQSPAGPKLLDLGPSTLLAGRPRQRPPLPGQIVPGTDRHPVGCP